MKKLYLHIGAGKTGSSALQTHFAINQKVLEKYNIYYPMNEIMNEAKKFRVTSGNGMEFAKLLNSDSVDKQSMNNLIKKVILEAGGKDILISSEIIQVYREENAKLLKSILNQLGYEVKIIYYVRAIADHLISTYHQVVKRHHYSKDFNNIINVVDNNFLRTIEKTISIFNSENTYVKNYDYVKKNIFEDCIVNILNIDNINEFTVKDRKINRSLSAYEISILKYMNKFFHKDCDSTFVSDALIDNNPHMQYSMNISVKELEKIKEKYENDLDKINRYISVEEEPLKLVNSLNIVENNNEIELNHFQQSVTIILAALVKEMNKNR
ncbi:MAG TPA: hypothetical protein ENK66_09665 [Arcobacter sp.]|nr:hypothetical protein [Arcobacter sp.]